METRILGSFADMWGSFVEIYGSFAIDIKEPSIHDKRGLFCHG